MCRDISINFSGEYALLLITRIHIIVTATPSAGTIKGLRKPPSKLFVTRKTFSIFFLCDVM